MIRRSRTGKVSKGRETFRAAGAAALKELRKGVN